jgi:hypothetical protein
MKCPICNEDNVQDLTTCQRCGFGLVLAVPPWPDASVLSFPEEYSMPQRTDSIDPVANVELSQLGPQLTWPEKVAIDGVDIEQPEAEIPVAEARTQELAAESEDALARAHIERGIEALREQMFDQARWEFEQARHLADDLEVVRMAEARLDDLRSIIDREVQERLSSIRPRSSSAPPSSPPVLPIVPAASSGTLVDWTRALRASVVFGLVAAILAALSGGGCIGIFATPVLALFAGIVAGARGSRLNVNSGVAGALVGLGGGLGGAVGRVPLAITEVTDLPSAVAMFLFFMVFYSFISTFAGLAGGLIAGARSRA